MTVPDEWSILAV